MSAEVPAKHTPWTERDLLQAYADAWRQLGVEPSRFTLGVCWGQAAIETGIDGPGCFNWNVGNVMGEDPETGAYHVLHKAPECGVNPAAIPGATVLTSSQVACGPGMQPYLPPGGSRFRAYSDLAAGCRDKLRVLARLWPRALWILSRAQGPDDAVPYAQALVHGVGLPLDAASAVLTLRASSAGMVPAGMRRYMSADEGKYGQDIRWLAGKCMATTPEDAWPSYAPPDGFGVAWLTDPALDGPASPLRASPGEHTVRTDDVEL